MNSAMLHSSTAPSSRAPLVMPLLTLMLLALLVTGTDAMWVPDDVAPLTPAPERGNLLFSMGSPMEDPGALPNRSTADTTEGSGITGLGNVDDYTDDAKWTEEGEEQWLGKLFPSFGHVQETSMFDDAKEERVSPFEATNEPGGLQRNRDFGKTDTDLFFEEDPPSQSSSVTNVRPTENNINVSEPKANADNTEHKTITQTKIEFKTSTKPIDNQPTTAFVSKSTTPSSGVMQSSTTVGGGNTLSHSDAVSPSQQTLAALEARPIVPTDDGAPVERHRTDNGSVVHIITDVPEVKPDADPAEDVGGTIVLQSSVSPAAAASDATATSTETAQLQQSTATETVPTQSAITITKTSSGVANNDEGSSPKLDSDSDTNVNTNSTHDSGPNPGLRLTSVPSLPTQVTSDLTPTSHPPSSLPICLQVCQSKINSLQLQVAPDYISMPQGDDIMLHCSLTKPTGNDSSVALEWRFKSENGSTPCSMGPSITDEAVPKCARTDAEAEEELSNQTSDAIRLTVPNAAPSDSGEYFCAVTLTCCEGTEHAQSVGRSEAAVVRIYAKPLYGVQLGALSVLCLCLLSGILGSACSCFQRRRHRKRRPSGRGHVYYEPVRLLHFPQPTTYDDVERDDGDDDDFDDAGARAEPEPTSAEMGSVRVNPMAEVPLTPAEAPPEAMPAPPEVVFPSRESEFEFPWAPTDLMKRMRGNVGFD